MSRGRLIIVDDEPVILRLLASVFEGEGYDLVTCSDGRSALAAIDAGVDVLLTDKNLPDVGGLELLEHAEQTLLAYAALPRDAVADSKLVARGPLLRRMEAERADELKLVVDTLLSDAVQANIGGYLAALKKRAAAKKAE